VNQSWSGATRKTVIETRKKGTDRRPAEGDAYGREERIFDLHEEKKRKRGIHADVRKRGTIISTEHHKEGKKDDNERTNGLCITI